MTKTLWTFVVFLACVATALQSRAALRYVSVNSTNATPPYTNWATAASNIQDAIDVAIDGDEVVVTNGVYETGGRGIKGVGSNRVAVTQPITVRSVNGSAVTVIRGYRGDPNNTFDQVRCAYLTNDAVLVGFTLTNGTTPHLPPFPEFGRLNYGGGVLCESVSSLLSNCVLTGNSAFLGGGGAYSGTLNNCALIGNSPGGASGSALNHCLVASNSASTGGGAHGGVLNNCALTGNSALYGGGASGSSLTNCILTGNSAVFYGGGSHSSALENCVVSDNSAQYGGGVFGGVLNNCTLTRNYATNEGGGAWGKSVSLPPCIGPGCPNPYSGPPILTLLNNCIVYGNSASNGDNYFTSDEGVLLNHSCTAPMPTNGGGNITNAPLLVNAMASNFRLQSNSPCINAGRNALAPAGFDLDGNPRIVGGTVDVGAHEFQSPDSLISYAWRQHYFQNLPPFGLGDFDDADSDGQNNWQEWRAGTNPRDSASVLRLLTPVVSGDGVIVRWQGGAERSYRVERKRDLSLPAFDTIGTNVPGQPGVTAYADTNAPNTESFFYRVRVED